MIRIYPRLTLLEIFFGPSVPCFIWVIQSANWSRNRLFSGRFSFAYPSVCRPFQGPQTRSRFQESLPARGPPRDHRSNVLFFLPLPGLPPTPPVPNVLPLFPSTHAFHLHPPPRAWSSSDHSPSASPPQPARVLFAGEPIAHEEHPTPHPPMSSSCPPSPPLFRAPLLVNLMVSCSRVRTRSGKCCSILQ